MNTTTIRQILFVFSILFINWVNIYGQTDTIKNVVTAPANTKKTFYVEPGSYGTKRESDPPAYVRELGKTGIGSVHNVNWLDVGLDHRIRYEFRNNDIRRPQTFSNDHPVLLRTRAFLGFKNVIDPFRAAVEFEDARRVNSQYPLDDRDVNTLEIIQAYGEINLKKGIGKDPLGNNRPVLFRAGRMAFEFLDRRLIASNQWRNTTNNFEGFRTSIGQDKNDWATDFIFVRPVIRLIHDFDKRDKNRLFWSAIGHWRRWSDIVTIEPFYLGLRQEAAPETANRQRQIHHIGLRLYGWVYDSGLNYDVNGHYQFGEDNNQKHRADGFTAELGYKWKKHKWKPRISLFYGYASGDKDPNDQVNNRFERFYGFARPWSSDDYIIMENVITPKIKLEFEPVKGVQIDGGYSYYWLASKTDRFNNLLSGSNFNRDRTGNSGSFIGHGLDSRIRFKATKFIDVNIGYTHFVNGEFVRNRQLAANKRSSPGSNFFYIELNFNAFDLFKKVEIK